MITVLSLSMLSLVSSRLLKVSWQVSRKEFKPGDRIPEPVPWKY